MTWLYRLAVDTVTIDIVLATCNGEKHLADQLDSILAQEYGHWRLLARDDGSTDGTKDILDAYAAAHSGKIRLLKDESGRLGVVGNFSRLLEHSTAEYTALCDQDDVWLPGKLAQSLAALQKLERACGPEKPALVFSDLIVVDENLDRVAQSFWAWHGVDPSRSRSFAKLLLRSAVTGCTVLINRALRELATPIPRQANPHDWWLALCAAAFGHIAAIERATVLYRQHGANAIGGRSRFARTVSAALDTDKVRRDLARTLAQADAFYARYHDVLPDRQSFLLREFLSLPQKNFFARWRTLSRLGMVERHSVYLPGFALLIPGRLAEGREKSLS